MQDQRLLWNDTYAAIDDQAETEPSAFARDVARRLSRPLDILELGCGRGVDAAFLAAAGHTVIATDLSDRVIEQDNQRYAREPRLSFRVVDMQAPLPFADGSFDLIYAHLTLHYFPDAVTRRIFGEIRRVLRPDGLLAFVCKTVDDPLYGRGELVEQDMYLLDGKPRHFFSQAYVERCLRDGWRVEAIDHGPASLYGGTSDIIRVIARHTGA
jgi:SAM-dependent methyltransferase